MSTPRPRLAGSESKLFRSAALGMVGVLDDKRARYVHAGCRLSTISQICPRLSRALVRRAAFRVVRWVCVGYSGPVDEGLDALLFCVRKERLTEMARKKGDRIVIKLKSTESEYIYYSEKNKRNDTQRLELKKYDPLLRRHVVFREAR